MILMVVMTLVAAGCGGDDSSADPTTAPANAGAGQADEPSGSDEPSTNQTTIPDDVSDVLDTDGGTGTVTIGDETWAFELVDDFPIASCDPDFFGGFVSFLTNAGAVLGNPTDSMSVMLPGGDFKDPPSVEVNLEASGGDEWVADETVYEQYPQAPAGLGVTSFSIDGKTASGTATFFEQESLFQFNAGNGDLVVADGSFTVSCGG